VTTTPPSVIVSGGGSAPPEPSSPQGRALWAVGALIVIGVILQVSLMPFVRIADGIPDLIACLVVAAAILRGPMVGGIAGGAGGLLVELTSPVGTLGVLALLYLLLGAWAGRYCEREESVNVLPPIVMATAGAAFVQLGYAGVQIMLGTPVFAADFTARVLVPSIVLTGLIAAPVLLIARRLLSDRRLTDPFQLGQTA